MVKGKHDVRIPPALGTLTLVAADLVALLLLRAKRDMVHKWA